MCTVNQKEKGKIHGNQIFTLAKILKPTSIMMQERAETAGKQGYKNSPI